MEGPRILRPMGLGDILDETFDLYRRNLFLFVAIAAVLLVPYSVLYGALSREWLSASSSGLSPLSPTLSPQEVERMLGSLGRLSAMNLIYVVLSVIMSAALTLAVSNRFLDRPATMVDSYAFILRRVGAFLLTEFLVGLMFLGAFVLILVGGAVLMVIFYFWTALVPYVFVVEGRKYGPAIRRSRDLARGQWGRIFVLGLLVGLITMVFLALASIVNSGLAAAGTKWMGAYVLSALFSGVASSFATPIPIIATIILYYDIRVRREGFDLEMLARELTSKPGGGSAPTTQE